MKKLNWKLIWEQFDRWVDTREGVNKECKTCGRVDDIYPEWDEQQKKIQQLVNKHLAKV